MNAPSHFIRFLEISATLIATFLIASMLVTRLNDSSSSFDSDEGDTVATAASSSIIYKPQGAPHLTAVEVQRLLEYLEYQFRQSPEAKHLSTEVETEIWYALQTRKLTSLFLSYAQCQRLVCRAEFTHASSFGDEQLLELLEHTVVTANDTLLKTLTDANGREKSLVYFPAPEAGDLVKAERAKTP